VHRAKYIVHLLQRIADRKRKFGKVNPIAHDKRSMWKCGPGLFCRRPDPRQYAIVEQKRGDGLDAKG
jgi:hypothetical protein